MVIEAPELITSVAFLASVTSGAIASAVGVMPMPTMSTLSLTIISWMSATRIVGNAAVVAHGEFDLAPGDGVAVLLHVKLDRGLAAADRQR